MTKSNLILAALVSLAISCAGVNGASVMKRLNDNTTPWTRGFNDKRYFNYKDFVQEDEKLQKWIGQQAISLARWEGSEEDNFFWFFEKNESLKKILFGEPGEGCVVNLAFDNVIERAKQASGRKWKNEGGWAVPSAITPWCNPNHAPKDGDTYPDDALGYQAFRPESETLFSKAFFVTLGNLGDMENNRDDTVKVEGFYPSYSTGEVLDEVEKDFAQFEVKILEIIRKDFAQVVNPYKFGKADSSKWTKKRKDILFGNN